VAHVIGGALGVASHAWGGLGQLHALVRHTSDSGHAVAGGHAGFGSGEMAHTVHASTHGLAHRVISAGSLGHHEFGPVSRSAQLEVHAALGHGGEGSAIGISGAAVHILGIHGHDVFHHSLAGGIHFGHAGSGHGDEESEDD